jgi:hypothetical protein
MAHEQHNGDRLFARWGDHWWLPDEDAIYFGDGFALHADESDGKLRFWLTVLEDEAERKRWEVVAEAQRQARRRDVAAIGALLERVDDWPEEAVVLRWAAGLCEAVGVPELAEGFARRLPAATVEPDARDQEARAPATADAAPGA